MKGKRVAGYIGAFLAGSILSGGVAMAATTLVQAQLTTSAVSVNGNIVGKPARLVYGGTSYVSLYAIQQALKQAGVLATWDGSKSPGLFSMTVPASSTSGGSTPSGSVVKVSQLPYTTTFSDGMKLTINSVNASSTATVLNLTIANVGTNMNADQAIEDVSSISDGGPQVAFVQEDDAFYQSPTLEPGQSVTGNVTFGPLMSGATQFTWYAQDFDANSHPITIALSE